VNHHRLAFCLSHLMEERALNHGDQRNTYA
jgi:hypothetical protein